MATSTKIVSTCVDDASVGSRIWANPSNATADDTNYATTPNVKNTAMHYLFGTMLGDVFAIPGGSTIDGVTVNIVLSQTIANAFTDGLVNLVIAGSAAGTSQGRGPSVFWPTTEDVFEWGSATNKWGNTLTPAIVNASDFGACIQGVEGSGNKSTGSVDFIKITVHYTEAVSKDIDGESTTAITSLASVSKTTNINGSSTTGVTTSASISKETNIDGELTTGITSSASVTKTTNINGLLTTGITTSASVSIVKLVDGELTTGITTDASISKITNVNGESITSVATDASVSKETNIDGELTTEVTTDASVSKQTNIDGELTTGVTTLASVLVVKPIDGELTTGVTTDAQVTKATGVVGSTTTNISTSGTVTKEISIEGSATTNISTYAEVEKLGDKYINGESTTAIATSASITKVTSINGSLQANISTSAQITRERPVAGSATTGILTDASITRDRPVNGELTTGVSTDAQITKTTGVIGLATTGIGTVGLVTVIRNVEGAATTAITTVGSVYVPPSPPFGQPMLPYLTIIGDGDTTQWIALPDDGTPDWGCVSPGVTPPDRSHWLRGGSDGKLQKFILFDIPEDLQIINYVRVFFDFDGIAGPALTGGIRAGIFLDDVLFESLKEMKCLSVSPVTKMLEWTGLNLYASNFRSAIKKELWVYAIDGGMADAGEEPNFQVNL